VKLTNKLGLPESLVAAVSHNDRDREGCDYTITELIGPPRQAVLKRQHWDALEEDVSERLWMLMGSAGHEVLRRAGKSLGKGVIEERAVVEFDGFKISGQIDLAIQGDNTMTDFKFTSVWAVKAGAKAEWEQQLNAYRWLAMQYGVAVDRLQIIALLRDWSKPEARRSTDYPQEGVVVLDIPIWHKDATEAWLVERIAAHEAAKATLPECTPEDTWERPAKWAVIKPGAKRATKLHDNPESAKSHAQAAGLVIEFRPGERPRCSDYCIVSEHCQQYAAWKTSSGIVQ
jgi:hypothetical protein